MKRFVGFEKGMGIGGWLTNYKRFNVLPDQWRLVLTDGDWEHFETYITEADVKRIADAGFDHIRLGFDQIVVEESPYQYSERAFRIIERFLSWCEKHKVNVVLNLHKCIGNYCDIYEEVGLFDSEELQNRFVALWLEVERRFHDKGGVAFELLNEVRDLPPEQWNTLAERAIGEIRKKNPTRKIIIGPTCWNDCSKLPFIKTYADENVIYTFHMYFPIEFTHQQGVLQTNPLYYNRKLLYPCDDVERYRGYYRLIGIGDPYRADVKRIDKEVLREKMQPAFDFVSAHPDAILWCGEFGTIRHADPASRENWMHDVISLLKEHEIPYSVWNYLSTPNDGNRFSLVDDSTREFLSERLKKILLGEE